MTPPNDSSELSVEWQELLRLIPGYDPFRDAAGCWFDETAARQALEFFPGALQHVEGDLAGQPFRLERWQQAAIANLIGWKKLDRQGREVRRYRECLLYVPRKNGKTPLIAGLGLFVLFLDPEAGQQNYIAAADREQAGKTFKHAKEMVARAPALSKRCRIYGGTAPMGQSKSIVKPDNSFLQILSADAETKHGGNCHLTIIEELHTQPNRDLVDVLTTSTASQNRKQPLTVYVTTADFNRPSICNEKHDYACKVRDGIIRDAAFLPVIYEALQSDPWDDPATWRKANPNLGVSVSLDYLERECQKAKEIPAYENTFRRLHLNQRTETDTRAVPMDKWDAAGEPFDIEELAGRTCYLGLDLSTTTDLSAVAALFPPLEAEPWRVLMRFWAPEDEARQRERRDRVPYSQWARQGFLKLTAGNVIDYDVIRADINAMQSLYAIKEIAADRWNATQIITQLTGDGFEVIAFGQGFASMTAPTKELLKLVQSGRLAHGGNPVLRWMASNMATETDAAGNLKPSKKKSTERIDGMVALVMALGRAITASAHAEYNPAWLMG